MESEEERVILVSAGPADVSAGCREKEKDVPEPGTPVSGAGTAVRREEETKWMEIRTEKELR